MLTASKQDHRDCRHRGRPDAKGFPGNVNLRSQFDQPNRKWGHCSAALATTLQSPLSQNHGRFPLLFRWREPATVGLPAVSRPHSGTTRRPSRSTPGQTPCGRREGWPSVRRGLLANPQPGWSIANEEFLANGKTDPMPRDLVRRGRAGTHQCVTISARSDLVVRIM